MSRYLIEKVNKGLADSGMPGGDVIVSIQYKKDSEVSQWLSNADCGGFCTLYQTDFNPFDLLVSSDVDNPKFGVGMIDSFEGITFNDYEDMFEAFRQNPDNPANSLLRYLIAITCCSTEEAKELVLLAEGKYIDEVDVPISDIEEEYLESESWE